MINCKHANLHIPYFTYPWSDPYCSQEHWECEVDNGCEDFELIGRLSG